jgi:hypothetical protein
MNKKYKFVKKFIIRKLMDDGRCIVPEDSWGDSYFSKYPYDTERDAMTEIEKGDVFVDNLIIIPIIVKVPTFAE